MCTANNTAANSAAATTKQPFYQNPQFWRMAGTGLAVGSGIMDASSAVIAGRAEQAKYNAQARTLKTQAALDEATVVRQNQYDLKNAAFQVKQARRAGRQNYGRQLAAAAASGMDLSSVSFEDAVLDSARAEQEDIDLIKKNASQRAAESSLQAELNTLTAQGQAKQMNIAGRYAKKAGRINAYSSILSSAARVAGIWGGK
ncbi:virion core protein, T7 gp14 family [Candidatus Avelusimicrobium fimicolum]|uniref:virion core protein, T7 gp14 family n=1 Tax=Candidatus Avelusimicrobium fimicolum TaxID=3416216 RepID=UPI003D1295F5